MSKKPVAFFKPPDPSFLVKLKKEAGYVEGPTVDTKREVGRFEGGSDDEFADDEPVVVVLKDGDLTADEADRIAKEKEAEKADEKADLNQRVIFQRPTGSKRAVSDTDTTSQKKPKRDRKDKKPTKKPLLSFDEEED